MSIFNLGKLSSYLQTSLLVGIVAASCTSQSAETDMETEISKAAVTCDEQHPGVEVFEMDSAETGRTHRIYVGYPLDYLENPDKRYDVIYLTDADGAFYPALNALRSLSAPAGDGLPNVILVGIGYPTGENKRGLDYTPSEAKHEVTLLVRPPKEGEGSGGAANFYSFISNELVPHIDSDNRTSGVNTIAGHSLGGLFALFCLQQVDSPFTNYLISSPSVWWEDRERLKVDPMDFDTPRTAYLSVGEFEQIPPGLGEILGLPEDLLAYDEATRMVDGIAETYDHLSAYGNLEVFAHIEEAGTHSGISTTAFARGVRILLPAINQGELRTRSSERPPLPWE